MLSVSAVSFLFFLAEEEDLAMPEVPADEAVADPVVAPEEEPRDFGVIPESPNGMTSFDFFFFLSVT